jgi:hypothetical protein
MNADAGDTRALRELELHYGFESMNEEREKIHRRRVELNDDEALTEDVIGLVSQAQDAEECPEKLQKLQDARKLAQRIGEHHGTKNDRYVVTMRLVNREMSRLECS